MFFAVAGIELSPWVPLLAAFGISALTSTAGVSGAFLLLPFQVSVLGFNSPAASATNHLFNVIATPAGVWRYHREGRLAWPLVWIIAVGTLPGVFIGAWLRIQWLADAEDFRIFAGLVLLFLGARLTADLLKKPDEGQASAELAFQQSFANPDKPGLGPGVAMRRFDIRRFDYSFCGQSFSLSVPALTCLSLAVGMVGGAYGIGGGAFIAPLLVTYFGMPVYVAAGPALMGTFFSSAAGTAFFTLLAPLFPHLAMSPDWMLGLLFGLGGIAGMYTGARLQKYLPAKLIKGMLAACIFVPAALYLRTPLKRFG